MSPKIKPIFDEKYQIDKIREDVCYNSESVGIIKESYSDGVVKYLDVGGLFWNATQEELKLAYDEWKQKIAENPLEKAQELYDLAAKTYREKKDKETEFHLNSSDADNPLKLCQDGFYYLKRVPLPNFPAEIILDEIARGVYQFTIDGKMAQYEGDVNTENNAPSGEGKITLNDYVFLCDFDEKGLVSVKEISYVFKGNKIRKLVDGVRFPEGIIVLSRDEKTIAADAITAATIYKINSKTGVEEKFFAGEIDRGLPKNGIFYSDDFELNAQNVEKYDVLQDTHKTEIYCEASGVLTIKDEEGRINTNKGSFLTFHPIGPITITGNDSDTSIGEEKVFFIFDERCGRSKRIGSSFSVTKENGKAVDGEYSLLQLDDEFGISKIVKFADGGEISKVNYHVCDEYIQEVLKEIPEEKHEEFLESLWNEAIQQEFEVERKFGKILNAEAGKQIEALKQKISDAVHRLKNKYVAELDSEAQAVVPEERAVAPEAQAEVNSTIFPNIFKAKIDSEIDKLEERLSKSMFEKTLESELDSKVEEIVFAKYRDNNGGAILYYGQIKEVEGKKIPHGLGYIQFGKPICRYYGEFENGLPNGVGTLVKSDGNKLKTIWKNGEILSGEVDSTITLKNPSGDILQYKGKTIDEKPYGKGELTITDSKGIVTLTMTSDNFNGFGCASSAQLYYNQQGVKTTYSGGVRNYIPLSLDRKATRKMEGTDADGFSYQKEQECYFRPKEDGSGFYDAEGPFEENYSGGKMHRKNVLSSGFYAVEDFVGVYKVTEGNNFSYVMGKAGWIPNLGSTLSNKEMADLYKLWMEKVEEIYKNGAPEQGIEEAKKLWGILAREFLRNPIVKVVTKRREKPLVTDTSRSTSSGTSSEHSELKLVDPAGSSTSTVAAKTVAGALSETPSSGASEVEPVDLPPASEKEQKSTVGSEEVVSELRKVPLENTAQLADLRRQVTDLRTTLSQLKIRLSDETTESSRLRGELRKAEKSLANNTKQVEKNIDNELVRENTGLKETLKSVRSELVILQEELKVKKRELDAATERNENTKFLNQRLVEEKRAKEIAENKAEIAEKSLEGTTAELGRLKLEIDRSKELLENETTKLHDIESELSRQQHRANTAIGRQRAAEERSMAAEKRAVDAEKREEQLKQLLRNLEEELEKRTQSLKDNNERKDYLTRHIEELGKRLVESDLAKVAADSEKVEAVRASEEKIRQAEERAATAERKRKEVESELMRRNQENADLREQVQDLESYRRMKDLLEEEIKFNENLVQENADLTSKLEALKLRMEDMREIMGDLYEKNSQLCEGNSKLNSKLKEQEMRIRDIEEVRLDLNRENSQLHSEVERLVRAKEESELRAQDAKQRLSEENAQLSSRLKEQETRIRDIEEVRLDLNKENSELNYELEEQGKRIRDIEKVKLGLNSKVEELVRAKEESELRAQDAKQKLFEEKSQLSSEIKKLVKEREESELRAQDAEQRLQHYSSTEDTVKRLQEYRRMEIAGAQAPSKSAVFLQTAMKAELEQLQNRLEESTKVNLALRGNNSGLVAKNEEQEERIKELSEKLKQLNVVHWTFLKENYGLTSKLEELEMGIKGEKESNERLSRKNAEFEELLGGFDVIGGKVRLARQDIAEINARIRSAVTDTQGTQLAANNTQHRA